MSVFTKILRAGEGRKVRALQGLVPDVNALEAEVEGLSDEDLSHAHTLAQARAASELAGSLLADLIAAIDT